MTNTTNRKGFSSCLIDNIKHLHSSPTVDGQTLQYQCTELEEEDEEEQEEIERAVPPATHIASCVMLVMGMTLSLWYMANVATDFQAVEGITAEAQ